MTELRSECGNYSKDLGVIMTGQMILLQSYRKGV